MSKGVLVSRIIPRFRYEEYLLEIDMTDCNEENISQLISGKKQMVLDDEKLQIHILQMLEPTEIM